MSEKISQIIFLGECIFIIPPTLLILFLAVMSQLGIFATGNFNLYNTAIVLFILIAGVAVTSIVVIGSVFINQGLSGTHSLNPKLWIPALLGVILSLSATVSIIFPPPPENSASSLFRFYFGLFILGYPMFIPLFHLSLERFLRKEKRSL